MLGTKTNIWMHFFILVNLNYSAISQIIVTIAGY
jgi:hypothetical protein